MPEIKLLAENEIGKNISSVNGTFSRWNPANALHDWTVSQFLTKKSLSDESQGSRELLHEADTDAKNLHERLNNFLDFPNEEMAKTHKNAVLYKVTENDKVGYIAVYEPTDRVEKTYIAFNGTGGIAAPLRKGFSMDRNTRVVLPIIPSTRGLLMKGYNDDIAIMRAKGAVGGLYQYANEIVMGFLNQQAEVEGAKDPSWKNLVIKGTSMGGNVVMGALKNIDYDNFDRVDAQLCETFLGSEDIDRFGISLAAWYLKIANRSETEEKLKELENKSGLNEKLKVEVRINIRDNMLKETAGSNIKSAFEKIGVTPTVSNIRVGVHSKQSMGSDGYGKMVVQYGNNLWAIKLANENGYFQYSYNDISQPIFTLDPVIPTLNGIYECPSPPIHVRFQLKDHSAMKIGELPPGNGFFTAEDFHFTENEKLKKLDITLYSPTPLEKTIGSGLLHGAGKSLERESMLAGLHTTFASDRAKWGLLKSKSQRRASSPVLLPLSRNIPA